MYVSYVIPPIYTNRLTKACTGRENGRQDTCDRGLLR